MAVPAPGSVAVDAPWSKAENVAMSKLRVLIVGASVAGPVTAYWFAKAGAHVTVIERFPDVRSGGQNVDIRSCGVTIMKRMPGLESAIRAKASPIAGVSLVRSTDGSSYGTLLPTGDPRNQSIVSEYEILRGNLARTLVDLSATMPRVRYVFGEQVATIHQPDNNNNNNDHDPRAPCTVEFLNGKLPTSQYDLVVAADGATSRTRALGFGCGVRDHMVPIHAWAAYCSLPGDLLDGSLFARTFSVPGGRLVIVAPDPEGHATRLTLILVKPRGSPEGEAALASFRAAIQAQGDNGDVLKRFVLAEFAGVGWVSDALARGLYAPGSTFYASEIAQVKPPSMYCGRLALVGDAGTAAGPTGGGTSLAMIGGYVLAGEVTTALRRGATLDEGLRAFEERMRPAIADLQKTPHLDRMAPQTAWGCWLRNLLWALFTRTGIASLLMRRARGPFGSGDEYGIPEYEWDDNNNDNNNKDEQEGH